ncbi:hypothetical protein J437_LFUL015404 [Ladona fulva]|uniref:Probable oligoribonuclease n=1 Tax=Ladona fulva TaxID=123851 RepID=A0A8K0KIS8_LADFU|nr:hypothetical protein J437_LFUL015404 [Ladona fulva]
MKINFSNSPLLWNFFHRNYSMQKRKVMDLIRSVYKYVWVDMEMTGLDAEKDRILEISCYLSDAEINQLLPGPQLVIHQPEHVLNSMDEWCTTQHNKTGLVEESRKSKVRESDAEKLLYDFLSSHIPYKAGIIAGNTVFMDKIFLGKYLPKVDDYLHYRILDVSTLKELCRDWYPKIYESAPKKIGDHRATGDILRSIEELRFYKANIFK